MPDLFGAERERALDLLSRFFQDPCFSGQEALDLRGFYVDPKTLEMFERLERRFGPESYEFWVPDKPAPAKKPAAKRGRPKNQDFDVADLSKLRGGRPVKLFAELLGIRPDKVRRAQKLGRASNGTLRAFDRFAKEHGFALRFRKTHSKTVQQK